MPGPKARTPAPIDRPLSRAYLREFTGWSTAYPPGISDPNSLRIMENVQITREGAARVRPGLRYVSYDDVGGIQKPAQKQLVGSYEPFFLNDGTQAYLFAVREDDLSVGFRALVRHPLGTNIKTLDEAGVDFDISDPSSLNFSSDTTFVKYLQIDNKIFALSNAGETMRLFTVGARKSAKRLSSVERPEFEIADKLVVVHPDANWVNAALPTSTRTNHFISPDMTELDGWSGTAATELTRSNVLAQNGVYSMRIASKPTKTNICPHPVRDAAVTGTTGWTEGGVATPLDVLGDSVRVSWGANKKAKRVWATSSKMDVTAGKSYRASFYLDGASANLDLLQAQYNYYNASGALIGDPTNITVAIADATDRKTPAQVKAPKGARSLKVVLVGTVANNNAGSFRFRQVLVTDDNTTAFFDGASGTDYFWSGAANHSESVYHPPVAVEAYSTVTGLGKKTYTSSFYVRAGSTVRNVSQELQWRKSTDAVISSTTPAAVADDAAAWTRLVATASPAPVGTAKCRVRIKIPALPRGEYHYVDSALFENAGSAGTYFDGDTGNTGTLKYRWNGGAHVSKSVEATYASSDTLPPAETATANTLVSNDKSKNKYNFGFFYTFNNEIGESAGSKMSVIRAQRPWAQWEWETPNISGEPSGTGTADGSLSADQLAAYMPQPVFEDAISQGATQWNLYMATWSDQDPVPVMAVLVDRRELDSNSTHAGAGWCRVTPDMATAARDSAPIPTKGTRFNYSEPSSAAQGLVAADRMVLVNDPKAAAVIRWSSSAQGSYTDFSASKGGGFKTLTSGNLFIPAVVKLWQNPQSVDTLTILCIGVDGYSTGYYMAPAQVASQSEQVNIMGFEETTATPGTTSPYGCEVMNNALYHPLDEQLMKSTATNYNINHKTLTEQISNVWKQLQSKERIHSSQHDNRLYYLVNNPDGAELEDGCRGNEVWVFDAASENGSWSRWLVQGHGLRKIEQGGKIAMSLVHPSGIYYFDDLYDSDDYVDPVTGLIAQRSIPWKLETNTQGANRAHDANAHLQQVNVTWGNFQGQARYGVRGWDLNGKPIDKSIVVRDTRDPSPLQWDLETFLLVQRDMREWFFYAESVTDDAGVVQKGVGQINLVQMRYAPVSVNTGYEFGSVETFEYQRASQPIDNRTTENGVPMPYIDTRRP